MIDNIFVTKVTLPQFKVGNLRWWRILNSVFYIRAVFCIFLASSVRVFFMPRLFRHWEIPTWKASLMGPNGLILTILISRSYRLWNYFSSVLPLYHLSVQTLFDHPLSPGECVQCTPFIIKSCAVFFSSWKENVWSEQYLHWRKAGKVNY